MEYKIEKLKVNSMKFQWLGTSCQVEDIGVGHRKLNLLVEQYESEGWKLQEIVPLLTANNSFGCKYGCKFPSTSTTLLVVFAKGEAATKAPGGDWASEAVDKIYTDNLFDGTVETEEECEELRKAMKAMLSIARYKDAASYAVRYSEMIDVYEKAHKGS